MTRRRRGLAADGRGTSAVEFALVATPFVFVMMGGVQMGIYYMTQSSLNAGVNATATTLRNSFNAAGTPSLPSGAQLKQDVVNGAGGMIYNNASTAVEIRQLSALDGGTVPISDGTTDYGTSNLNVPLALRAEATVLNFAPGFGGTIQVYASAVVRREGR
jgi:Flp pilus assembly protein TadG